MAEPNRHIIETFSVPEDNDNASVELSSFALGQPTQPESLTQAALLGTQVLLDMQRDRDRDRGRGHDSPTQAEAQEQRNGPQGTETNDASNVAGGQSVNGADEPAPTVPKKPTRTHDPRNEEVYRHFKRAGNDKGGNTQVICIYCDNAYQASLDRYERGGKRSFRPVEPKRIRKRKATCISHLDKCRSYKKACVGKAKSMPNDDTSSIASRRTSSKADTPVSELSVPRSTATVGPKSTIPEYFYSMMDDEQAQMFNRLALELIIDVHAPFNFIERPSFHRLVDFLRPKSSQSLVSRFTIGGTRLSNLYEEAIERRNASIQEAVSTGEYFGWIVDGWEMANSSHVEGVIYRCGRQSFLLDALEGLDTHHAIAIARQWENNVIGALVIKGNLAKDRVSRRFPSISKYFLSDDAGYCRRARQILALRYPHILFLKCKAHQVNLMVGHLLDKTEYASWVSKAVASASKIKKSSSKWYKRLQDLCDERYGKCAATTIMTLADTRWNSLQGVLASLLRIRTACEDMSFKYRSDKDFPTACRVWHEERSFWHKIMEAELLIRPFCDASFLMQSEDNTLADVLLMMINLVLHVQEFTGDKDQADLVLKDLRARWETWEQPLYVLAFALHPIYSKFAMDLLGRSHDVNGEWPNTKNVFSARRLAHCAKFYYVKHRLSPYDPGTTDFLKDVTNIEVAVYQMIRGKPVMGSFPYDPMSFTSLSAYFQENEAVNGKAFTRFAVFLFSCPVQGASCERLFKDFNRYHTKTRNRLSRAKMVMSTQIKYDMKNRYEDKDSHSRESSSAAWSHTNKNRFVNPDEHEQVDNSEEEGGGDDEPEETGAANVDPTEDAVAMDTELDVSVLTAMYPDEVVLRDTNLSPELRTMLVAIHTSKDLCDDDMVETAQSPSEADRLDASSLDESAGVTFEAVLAQQEAAAARAVEDPPEAANPGTELEDLPLTNEKNYPQENRQYFMKKNYCRNDKYPLEAFIHRDVPLPSIISAFKHKPKGPRKPKLIKLEEQDILSVHSG